MFDLYPYQERAVAFCEQRDGKLGLLADMRTGKTRISLAYLHDKATRILVVAPLWVTGVWEREMRDELNYDYAIVMLTGKSIKQRAEILHRTGDRTVVVTNFEAYWREPFRSEISKWLRGSPDSAIILDEAHKIRTRGAKQSRFAHVLAPQVKYRLALTGTPICNGLEDLFSLYRFIDSQVFGSRWADFERDYIRYGGYMGYTIVGYRNAEIAAAKVHATSFQITREEAIGPTDEDDTPVPVVLSPATRDAYAKLNKEAITEIEGTGPDGLPKTGLALTRSALTMVLRLQQLTSGFINTDEGLVDLSDDKLDVCEQIVNDAWEQKNRAVIFCRFRRDIERVAQRLRLPSYAMLMGRATPADRTRALTELSTGALRAVVAQITLASLGVDMSGANVAVFYSVGFSLTDFTQALARLHGPRQTKHVSNFHLVAANSVDEKVYEALKSKQNIAAQVVNLGYARRLFA